MSYRGSQPAHIHFAEDLGLPQILRRLTEGAGVDTVLNASAGLIPEELITSVAPFGTILDMHGHRRFPAAANQAINYASFNAAQLLRHRPLVAGNAFNAALSMLLDENFDPFLPVTTVSIADAGLAFKAIQGQTGVGKMVLLADEDAMVDVKETSMPTSLLAGVEGLVQAVTDLTIRQEQTNDLLALIARLSARNPTHRRILC
ncbi:hypothetical protein BJ170DRAFT_641071 [Xylariales sp. AK1849]|nr:hypothetical protein BJ170DRAFT_641071 [Xylariales sp. AK1849]